jgi:hypothetical protein
VALIFQQLVTTTTFPKKYIFISKNCCMERGLKGIGHFILRQLVSFTCMLLLQIVGSKMAGKLVKSKSNDWKHFSESTVKS